MGGIRRRWPTEAVSARADPPERRRRTAQSRRTGGWPVGASGEVTANTDGPRLHQRAVNRRAHGATSTWRNQNRRSSNSGTKTTQCGDEAAGKHKGDRNDASSGDTFGGGGVGFGAEEPGPRS